MKQFDIYQVSLDPTAGAEMRKSRPGVILSPDVMNKHLDTVIIAPLTHTIRGYPSRVASRFKGEPGEIVLDQIRSVDKQRLKKKIGKLDGETSMAALKILQAMFQIPKSV